MYYQERNIHSITHQFIPQSLSRHSIALLKAILHKGRQSAPLAICSIISFLSGHSTTAYIVFSSSPKTKFSFKIAFYKAVPKQYRLIQMVFLLFIISRIFLSPFTLYNTPSLVTLSHLIIFTIFSSTTFQNFQGIYNLLFEASNLQHRTKLCSKDSTLQFPLPIFEVKGCPF